MQKAQAHNYHLKEKTKGLPLFPICVCIVTGATVTVAMSLFFGWILSLVDLPLASNSVFVLLSLFFGAFVCGAVCAKAFPGERGLMALICGCTVTIFLVVANLLLFRQPITVLSFAKYIVIILSCLLGAMVTGAVKPARKKHGKKRH